MRWSRNEPDQAVSQPHRLKGEGNSRKGKAKAGRETAAQECRLKAEQRYSPKRHGGSWNCHPGRKEKHSSWMETLFGFKGKKTQSLQNTHTHFLEAWLKTRYCWAGNVLRKPKTGGQSTEKDIRGGGGEGICPRLFPGKPPYLKDGRESQLWKADGAGLAMQILQNQVVQLFDEAILQREGGRDLQGGVNQHLGQAPQPMFVSCSVL